MRPIAYRRAIDVDDAVHAGADAQTAFLGGGTSLVDLMKLEVLNPARVVDVSRLDLSRIETVEGGIRLGATATNTAVANHPEVKRRFPLLAEALLSGASPQLRNVATVAGNLMQRTRCMYFRDLATRCNKRVPGSGCDARQGWTRMHAILGGSEACIAVHPSDMCVALAALDATVHVRGKDGEREIPFARFHLLPGDHPEREFALTPGELVTSVFVPALPSTAHSRYVKARERLSYAFALASCGAVLDVEGGTIRAARIALGGIATKPWRATNAERALAGEAPRQEAFRRTADLALADARTTRDNAFKVELAKRCIVRALTLCAEAG